MPGTPLFFPKDNYLSSFRHMTEILQFNRTKEKLCFSFVCLQSYKTAFAVSIKTANPNTSHI